MIDAANARAWAHRGTADAAWRAGDYELRDAETLLAEKADKECRKWTKRKEAMEKCCHGMGHASILRCTDCGVERISVPLGCNQRFCPRCVPKIRAQNIAKVDRALEVAEQRQKKRGEPKTHWRMLMPTMRSYPDGQLLEMRDFFAKCLGKAFRTKWWKDRVRAWVVCYENTRSKKGWHLHCNVLVDAFLPQAEWGALWEKITGGRASAAVQHISDVGSRAAAVREAVKYAGKDLGGSDVDGIHDYGIVNEPERFAEFVLAMERFRTLRTYGDCYEREEEEEAEEPHVCEECGGVMEFDRTVWLPQEELAARIKTQLERDRERRRQRDGPDQARKR